MDWRLEDPGNQPTNQRPPGINRILGNSEKGKKIKKGKKKGRERGREIKFRKKRNRKRKKEKREM
jgi:hypothetical protein